MRPLRSNQPLIAASAPVAQLDRVSGYEPEGRAFESLRAHHFPFQSPTLFIFHF